MLCYKVFRLKEKGGEGAFICSATPKYCNLKNVWALPCIHFFILTWVC